MENKINYTKVLQALIKSVWSEMNETGIKYVESMSIPQGNDLWVTVEAVEYAGFPCVQVSLITRRENSILPVEKSENAAKLWDRDILWDGATQPYKGPNSENVLNGGFILVSSYADMTDEESRALKDNDEWPECLLAIKISYLRDYIKDDFDSLEQFFSEYTFDATDRLFYGAIDSNAAAFEYRPDFPDKPFLLPDSCGGEAILAFADFMSRKMEAEKAKSIMARMSEDTAK